MQRQVQEHIVAGQIPQAMAVIEQAAPGTLGSHPRIKFQLLCQQFVEMVRVQVLKSLALQGMRQPPPVPIPNRFLTPLMVPGGAGTGFQINCMAGSGIT